MSKTSNQSLPVTVTLNDLNNLFEKSEKRILKEIDKRNFATKKDVEDIVHNQLTEFHYNMVVPELEKLSDKIDNISKEFVKKKDFQKLYA